MTMLESSKKPAAAQRTPDDWGALENQGRTLAVKAAPPRRVAAEIADKLAIAEARVGELEARRADAVVDDAVKKPGAAEALATVEKALALARAEVERLRAGLARAQERDQAADAEARAKLQASQFAALQQHARARLEATVAITAALEAAVGAYADYVAASQKMVGSTPIGCTLPTGADDQRLTGQIAAEMYRLSAGRGVTLPGAHPPTIQTRDLPGKIPPLLDHVKNWNDTILASIRAQLGRPS